jgi:hypothetical protein
MPDLKNTQARQGAVRSDCGHFPPILVLLNEFWVPCPACGQDPLALQRRSTRFQDAGAFSSFLKPFVPAQGAPDYSGSGFPAVSGINQGTANPIT